MARRRGGREKKSVVGVEGAEFFKVFIPDLTSHQLMIPPDFIKKFKKTMKEKVILKDKAGKTWYVDVKETSNGVFLKDGWQRFIDDQGLKIGDFLVFRYDGSYSFIVKVFGTNGCKKETSESKNIATHAKSIEGTDEMEPKQTSRKRVVPQNEVHLSSVDRRVRHLKRFGEVNEEQEKVGASEKPENSRKFENTEQVVHNCPSFVASPSGASRYAKLRIPEEVMNAESVHLEPEMILRNAQGKEWPVRIFTLPDGPTFLGKGLFAFQVDNNVGPKDSCKFTFGTERFSTTINVEVLCANKFLDT